MKNEYIIICSLLIALFGINAIGISFLRRKNPININNNNEYTRLLNDYDTSGRNNEEDIESIENCESSSENYFSYYTEGKQFRFDKYIDARDSVNNIFLITNSDIFIIQEPLINILKGEKEEGSESSYLGHIGGFFVFVGLAGVSLILWGLYWHCWLKKSCCMKEYHNPINIRAFWWISFIGFCGVFACCISGIVTSYNFNNMVGSIKCAYERIYYDSQYGELKTSSTKWKGFKNNDNLFNEYKKIINSNNYTALEINSEWKTERVHKNDNYRDILDPELKYDTNFIDAIYNIVENNLFMLFQRKFCYEDI